MVYTIELTPVGSLVRGYTQARVWIDELPASSFEPTNTLREEFPASGSELIGSRTAAIEWRVATGPRSQYALLGGRWEPGGGASLVTYLSIREHGLYFDGALNPRSYDLVRSCFPREFAAGVHDAFRQCSSLVAGTITLGCAGMAQVSSSQYAFERVTRALIELLQTPVPLDSEADVERVVMKMLGLSNQPR